MSNKFNIMEVRKRSMEKKYLRTATFLALALLACGENDSVDGQNLATNQTTSIRFDCTAMDAMERCLSCRDTQKKIECNQAKRKCKNDQEGTFLIKNTTTQVGNYIKWKCITEN